MTHHDLAAAHRFRAEVLREFSQLLIAEGLPKLALVLEVAGQRREIHGWLEDGENLGHLFCWSVQGGVGVADHVKRI